LFPGSAGGRELKSHHPKMCHFYSWGFQGGASGKKPACQCKSSKRLGFNSWVGKIPWRRAQQPTLVFLPGESHGQRRLEGLQSIKLQRVGHN